MVKRQNKIKVKYIVLSALVLLITLITIICGGGVGGAYAAAVDYSGVMQDLEKDENFNPEDYPQKSDDYSLQVIQIAESTDGKLFIYIYNPCGVTRPLIATCVNMSLSESVDKTKLYNLTYLSSNGVFGKYLVNGVTVSEETKRYYNITSIYRKWIKGIDEETGNDNTINEVSYKVGQFWTVTTNSDGVNYSYVILETITVTDKYCGYMRFYDGYKLYKSACDSYYIAFSTDRFIETLLEAYVSFVTKDYTCNITSIQNPPEMGGGAHNFYDYIYADPVPQQVRITADQQGGNTGDGLGGIKYLWDRIEKVSDFLADKNNDFTTTAEAALKDKQWVLRFVDIPYVLTPHFGGATETGTKVTDETILRLKFETDGIVYDLGVVDNKQTGGYKPSNNPNGFATMGFFEYLWYCLVCLFTGTGTLINKIIGGVILFVCLILLPSVLAILSFVFPAFGAVMKTIFKGIWTGIKWLFIGLWYVISSPVRLIIWIVYKARGE